jgi:hypothetical protein
VASGIVEPQDSQGTGETQAPGAVTKHSKLVERLLNASSSLPAFIHDLLTTQAVVVAATEAAAFLIEAGGAAEDKAAGQEGPGLRPVSHIRPENANPATRGAALSAFKQIVTQCLAQGRDGAVEINAIDGESTTVPAEPQFCLITLLRQETQIVAVTAVITRCLNAERARQRLVAMQIVAGYFELYNLKRNAEQAQIIAQSHQHVLQLATAVATAQGFASAGWGCAMNWPRARAARVTLGWIKGQDVKVVAFSHTEEFDKKQEMVVELQKVMEECIDQDEPVHFVPNGGEATTSRGRRRLFRGHRAETRCFRCRCAGTRRSSASSCWNSPERQAGAAGHGGLTVSVDLLAPQLYDRYENDRWLITKTGLSIKELTKKAIGPQYMLAKVISVTVALVLIIVCTVKMTYHVSAPFEFAPVAKTTIPCPVDGYIQAVYVRPGMTVKKGDPLVQFRTVELEKKLHEAEADAAKAGRCGQGPVGRPA